MNTDTGHIKIDEKGILEHRYEKLSIILPVYNEEKTLRESYNRLKQVDFPIDVEIIIVDDCSVDGSSKIIESILREDGGVIFYRNPYNMGKGASVAKGLSLATGTILTMHDADLEYDPNDLKKMVDNLLENGYDAIYGARPFSFNLKNSYKRNIIGNLGLSFAISLIYFRRILDVETCYKMFRREAIRGFSLESKRFDIEIEITAKLIRSGYEIHFIDISYYPRTYDDGKKIGVKDGIIALIKILEYRFAGFRDKEELLEPVFRYLRAKNAVKFPFLKKKVLDIGCGRDFRFLQSIKNSMSLGVGIDQHAENRHCGNIFLVNHRVDKSLLFEDSTFDVVTAWAVLEHIEQPDLIAKEAYRVLKNGGHLLATVPSFRSKWLLEFLSYKLNIVSKREIKDHKHYLTRKQLVDIFKKANFDKVNVKAYNLGMNYFISGGKYG